MQNRRGAILGVWLVGRHHVEQVASVSAQLFTRTDFIGQDDQN